LCCRCCKLTNEQFVVGYGATQAVPDPLFTFSADFAFALLAFGLLMFWKWPPWVVVVLTALGGENLARI
jgi:hypothetical protein